MISQMLKYPDFGKPVDPFDGRKIEGVPEHIRERWARSLKGAGEYELAEEVFPDTPETKPETELEAA